MFKNYKDLIISIVLSIIMLFLANPIIHNITYIKDNVSPILGFVWFLYTTFTLFQKISSIQKTTKDKTIEVLLIVSVISYSISFMIPYSSHNDLKSNLHVDLSLLSVVGISLISILFIQYIPYHSHQQTHILVFTYSLVIFIIIASNGINTLSEVIYFILTNFYLKNIEMKLVDKNIIG